VKLWLPETSADGVAERLAGRNEDNQQTNGSWFF
jgi:hypothetical protein